jgi:hypothetical protein
MYMAYISGKSNKEKQKRTLQTACDFSVCAEFVVGAGNSFE